jgi:hypothetical protein
VLLCLCRLFVLSLSEIQLEHFNEIEGRARRMVVLKFHLRVRGRRVVVSCLRAGVSVTVNLSLVQDETLDHKVQFLILNQQILIP